jgi:hypothetical protein
MQAESEEDVHDWAHELDKVARSVQERLREAALRSLSTVDVGTGPLGQYLGYKCCTVRDIEGMGFYVAQEHPREGPQTLYVFEVHTDQGYWKVYKRFSKFHDVHSKLSSCDDQTTITLPALPSNVRFTALSESDLGIRFKDLFDWLQSVMDRLVSGCASLLVNGFSKHRNAKIFKQAQIFWSFICEGANCPTKPESGMLDDWATPIDWDMPELNDLAQRLDLNYDPVTIDSVPWMQHVVSPRDADSESTDGRPTGTDSTASASNTHSDGELC